VRDASPSPKLASIAKVSFDSSDRISFSELLQKFVMCQGEVHTQRICRPGRRWPAPERAGGVREVAAAGGARGGAVPWTSRLHSRTQILVARIEKSRPMLGLEPGSECPVRLELC
jgi:hypothetical protein